MNVLFVHAGALGDCIGILPALAFFKSIHPQWHCTFLGQNTIGTFFKETGVVAENWNIDSRNFLSLFTTNPQKQDLLVFEKFDTALLFTNPKSLFVHNLQSVIPRVFSHKPFTLKKELVYQYHLNAVASYLNLSPKSIKHPLLSMPISDSTNSSTLLPTEKSIFIHPGSGSKKKNWPLENFLTVAVELRKDFSIHWILGYAEEDYASKIPKQDKILKNLSLMDLAKEMRSACLYLGNDSGISHVAGALNIPSIVLFGVSDFEIFKPCGECVTVVSPEVCENISGNQMNAISVARVLEKCWEIYTLST